MVLITRYIENNQTSISGIQPFCLKLNDKQKTAKIKSSPDIP